MYNYKQELDNCSKEDLAAGVVATLKCIMSLRNTFTLGEVLSKNNLYGSSWRQMMFVDMLVEIGYIRKVDGRYEAAQFQSYVKNF